MKSTILLYKFDGQYLFLIEIVFIRTFKENFILTTTTSILSYKNILVAITFK